MAHLSLALLGPLQTTLAGIPLIAFAYDKVRALLIYLAAEADRPHRRDALTGLLWPDLPDATARRNLSQALFNLRQVLGDHSATPPYLQIARESIQFNPHSDHWLDVAVFSQLLASCDTHTHRRLETCDSCLQRLEQAVALYRGSFIEQFFLSDSVAFEEWALLKRAWFQQRALESLARLAAAYERLDDVERTCGALQRLLALDPWREEAHRDLMGLLAQYGQRSAALRQYEVCRHALHEALGVEPAAATTALYLAIRDGGIFPVPIARPPQRYPATRLPQPPTALIGRLTELAKLADRLEAPACRLITIVGAGGIGKTRLALAAAEQRAVSWRDGVVFVPLVAVASAAHLETAILTALDVPLQGQRDPRDLLLNYLRKHELLLVLDNIEHLVSEPGLLQEILRSTSGVTLLITSRVRLALQAEWLVELDGLPYPAEPPDDAIEASSAVLLFTERARQLAPGFVLRADERQAVSQICRYVGGNPLGIELAATWMRTLSCQEIAAEMAHNLDLLTTTQRDLPERHRSLRAVLDHSWGLLSTDERRVFCQLATFQGGCTRAAAEQVTGASVALLQALVDASLLRRTAAGRYEMHEFVRHYGAEQLAAEPQEQEAVSERHATYYLTWLAQQEHLIKSAAYQESLAAIRAELANIRSAWGWVSRQRHTSALASAISTMEVFYEKHGWFPEAIMLFEQAAVAFDEGVEQEQRLAADQRMVLGHLLECAGHFRMRDGQLKTARVLLERGVRLLRPLDAPMALSDALLNLGVLLHLMGEYHAGQQHMQESLDIRHVLGDRWGSAACLFMLGRVTHWRGAHTEAYRLLSEALAYVRAIGDPYAVASVLSSLSAAAYAQQMYAEAQHYARESLTVSRPLDYHWAMAEALDTLGMVARAQGAHAEAQQHLRDSIAHFQEIGERWSLGRVLNHLGEVCFAQQAHSEARQYFCAALQMARDVQAIPIALDALVGLARLLAHDGERELPCEVASQILNHPASTAEARRQARQLEIELSCSPQSAGAPHSASEYRSFETLIDAMLAGSLANQEHTRALAGSG
jgi:predicted ATPase/DNA-binding SARP family transcriptional activator